MSKWDSANPFSYTTEEQTDRQTDIQMLGITNARYYKCLVLQMLGITYRPWQTMSCSLRCKSNTMQMMSHEIVLWMSSKLSNFDTVFFLYINVLWFCCSIELWINMLSEMANEWPPAVSLPAVWKAVHCRNTNGSTTVVCCSCCFFDHWSRTTKSFLIKHNVINIVSCLEANPCPNSPLTCWVLTDGPTEPDCTTVLQHI